MENFERWPSSILKSKEKCSDLALSFSLDLGLVIPWAVTCELLHSATLIHDELLNLFTVMSSRIVAGQVEEFDLNKFEGEKNLFEKYLICISGKTSSLFSGLAIGVGITAGISKEALQFLESIFFQLGHIFQIQDDILDLSECQIRS